MAAKAITGDLSVFTVASVSQLAVLSDASILIDHETEDGSPLNVVYESDQIVGSSARLRASLMTTVSGSTKANNLDVAAFSVGGTDYLGWMDGGSLDVEWSHEEAKAVGDRWAYPVAVGKRVSMEGDLKVPATGGAGLALLMDGSTSDLDVDASFTINGTTVTFAALLKSLEHTFPKKGVQRHRVTLTGRAPDSGTFPAAPTGTTGIVAHFLNSLAAQAFVLTSKVSGGATYSGNMLPLSYRLRWANNSILVAECEWASQGTVSISATA
jgi:hypothetical protein